MGYTGQNGVGAEVQRMCGNRGKQDGWGKGGYAEHVWEGKAGRDEDRSHIKGRNAKVKKIVGAEVRRTGGGQGHTSVVIGTWDGVWIELHRTELGLGT